MQGPYGPDNNAISESVGGSFRRIKLELSPEYRRGEERQSHQPESNAIIHKVSPSPLKSKSGPQKRMSLDMFLELVDASERLLGRSSRTSLASAPQGTESSYANDLHSSISSLNTDQFHSSRASLNADYLHSSRGSLNIDQFHSSRNSINIDQFHSSRTSINNDHQQSSRSASNLYSSRNTNEYSFSSTSSNNNVFHSSRSSLPQPQEQRAPSPRQLPKSPQSQEESPCTRNIISEVSRTSIGRMAPSTTPIRSSAGRASSRPPREIIAPMLQRLVSPPSMSPPFTGNSGIRRSQSEEAGEASPSNHSRSTNRRSSIGRTDSGQSPKLNSLMPQRLTSPTPPMSPPFTENSGTIRRSQFEEAGEASPSNHSRSTKRRSSIGRTDSGQSPKLNSLMPQRLTSPTPPMSPPFSGNSGMIRRSQSEQAGEDSPHSRSSRPSIGNNRSGQNSQVRAQTPNSPALSVNSFSPRRSQSEQTREEVPSGHRDIRRTRSGQLVQSSQQSNIHSFRRSRSSVSSSEMVLAKDVRSPDPTGNSGRYSTGTVSRHSSGAPCGNGRLESCARGSDDGQRMNGVWSGYGRLVNKNGDSFEGYFVEGCKHGKGSTVYPDGRVFDGLFRMGEMAEGTMHYQDGGSYVGKFKNGKRHYQGTYNFPDGSVFHGDFRDDRLEGRGQLTWNNGAKYVGEWENGQRHGLGREYAATHNDGSIVAKNRDVRASGVIRYEGVWTHGKPSRQSCFEED